MQRPTLPACPGAQCACRALALLALAGRPSLCLAQDRFLGRSSRLTTVSRSDDNGGWRFLHAYPAQYLARRLGPSQRIEIDGDLTDSAWAEVPFTATGFQDIAQPLFPGFRLPARYATRVKVRWDSDFLYVAADLGEPFVTGAVTGHNPTLASTNPLGNVPYYDNDFEIFLDVSGTNHFYKEFEMNSLGATYDVLWRVPDSGLGSTGVPCCSDNACARWCQNSSYPAFGGHWSMYPGLKVATGRRPGGWTAEVALPLRGGRAGAGGLLDGGSGWDRFDPVQGARHWYVDFARAEHPFFTANASLLSELCSEIKTAQPTLLGTDQWSCYYEYVWQPCGGHRYMHNPDTWGVLQFTASDAEEECRVAEWPARYILAQVYQLQVALVQQHGSYATELRPWLQAPSCSPEIGCNGADLLAALTDFRDIFNLEVSVDNSATSCVKYASGAASAAPSGGPCFRAQVRFTPPGAPYTVLANITEERLLGVEFVEGPSQGGDIARMPSSGANTFCLP